jgi:hypothetical protein
MKHSKRSRSDRRAEAEARQEATATLTPQERMTNIRSRPGDSTRERERMIAAIESGAGHVTKKKKSKAKSGKDFQPTSGGHGA